MELKKIGDAPDQGILYALYTDKVEFKKYEKSSLVKDFEDNLLELHLFDKETEYRYIKRRKDAVEIIINDQNYGAANSGKVESYIEKVMVQEDFKANAEGEISFVEVVNYIKYDENDLLRIDNYRLKEVE